MYKRIFGSSYIYRVSDGASFPDNPDNKDYTDVLAWLDAGNTLLPADVPVIEVPKVVTMRQARLVLLQQGLLSQVSDFIEVLPEPQRTVAKIEWEYSQEVHRDKELVALLATTLALSEQDLDNLFIAAAAL